MLPINRFTLLLDMNQPEWVCLRMACSVWVLDFPQERFHNMSPGDFDSMLIMAGDSKAQERLRVEEATGVSQGGAAVSSLGSEGHRDRSEPGRGCC